MAGVNHDDVGLCLCGIRGNHFCTVTEDTLPFIRNACVLKNFACSYQCVEHRTLLVAAQGAGGVKCRSTPFVDGGEHFKQRYLERAMFPIQKGGVAGSLHGAVVINYGDQQP